MKVAVIGAGIAGLTFSQLCQQRGHDVTVFEKSRGRGGRLASKRLDWGTIDIGAQYFTAHDPRFKEQLATWLQKGAAERWDFTPFVTTDEGISPSPDNTERYVGTAQMNSIAHSLSIGLNIQVSTEIKALHHTSENNQWRLQDKHDQFLDESFDAVIVSAPAEQSAKLLTGTALKTRIPQQIDEPCWTLALATRGKVNADVQGIFGDNTIAWLSRLSARPQRAANLEYDDLWMLHFSADWSRDKDKHSEDAMIQIGINWLNSKLQRHTHSPLELMHHYRHYWRYARLKSNYEQPKILFDKFSNIAAIGDWLVGGRVEGAYLSALDLAEQWFD